MVHNEIALRQKLEQMATPELKELLEGETGKELPDDDLVLLVLDILEERTADKPIVLTPGEQVAWKTYQKRARKRAGVPRWVRTAVAAAATLGLVLGMMFVAMPQEAKAGSIFDVIAYCTDGLLEFFGSSSDESMQLDYEFKTEHLGLQKLHDTVVEYGYDGPAVPMWVPEEYHTVLSLDVDKTPRCVCITSVFTDGNNQLLISFYIFDNNTVRGYSKDLTSPKELELFGTVHRYVNNLDVCTAVWEKDNIEGSITLDCHEDILRRILKSIYVMEEI